MRGERRRAVWAGGATLVVGAAVVAAAIRLGSPAERRLRRLDEERISSLQSISSGIRQRWETGGRLPEVELSQQRWMGRIDRDPETGKSYDYERIDERRYRLCATFARPSAPPERPREPEFWVHPAGRHCFELAIEEQQPATP